MPNPKFNLTNIQKRLKSLAFFKFLILAVLVFSALFSASLFYLLTINKTKSLPLQKAFGQDVGNMNREEIVAVLRSGDKSLEDKKYKLIANSKQYNFTPAEIGLSVDADLTAEKIITTAKSGTVLENIGRLYQFYNSDREDQVEIKVNNSKLKAFLDKIGAENYTPEKAPEIIVGESRVDIKGGTEGERVDKFGTEASIIEMVKKGDTDTVQAHFTHFGTKISDQNKSKWLDSLNKTLASNLAVFYDGRSKTLTRQQLTQFVKFDSSHNEELLSFKVKDKNIAIFTGNDTYASNLSIDQEQVNSLVTKIKSEVNQDPVDARFSFDGNRVTAFTASRDGKELDSEKAKKDITTALLNGEGKVTLAVKTTPSKITNDSVNNMGIKDLLGTGISRFTGSGEGRIFNLNLGSQRLNGVLVPPGETFSMYKAIGDVENSTGFKEAYVIINGRTQVGVGGGICQVSTTLFRAVLNSGLPIVERYPHAYRVGYYEVGFPPGLDASVYFPTSDFKFKNDTPGYVLVQTTVDLRSSTLTYNIYGTKDGREVSTTQPVVGNVRPAPAPLYQDDPTLPAGTVKQVDFAASGANVSFKRTVTKDGAVVAQDTFISNYQPWQAVFLRGTKAG